MGLFSALNRQQKEAIGLLQIGTLLEYFDLLLYIHMAVLLNELFFPPTDKHSAALLSAFAFCSTFVLSPIGALLFGYIGDNFGRKTTVVMTSMMMALACAVMAILPTYAEIGIAASFFVTACRVLQGLSSMGEINGAEIYLSEITKPPTRYLTVSLVDTASAVGGFLALLIANVAVNLGFNWRIAFIIGSGIAIIGSVARTRLRETPDFVDMKRRIRRVIEETTQDELTKVAALLKSTSAMDKEKVCLKTTLATFLLYASRPVFFYFSYIYCGSLLKNQFHYTSAQVLQQNLIVSVFNLIGMVLLSILSYKIHPLKLVRFRLMCFIPVMLFIPSLLYNMNSPMALLALQVFCICFAPTDFPASAVVVIHFPVFKRFTWISMLHALSRMLPYLITSFGLVYAIKYFHYWGFLIIMIPVVVGFTWGLQHFSDLEAATEFVNLQEKNIRGFKSNDLNNIGYEKAKS